MPIAAAGAFPLPFADRAATFVDEFFARYPHWATSIGDHFHAKDLWETPDTVQTLMQYPKQELQAHFEGTFSSARNAAMSEFMGTEATLYIDRGRYEVIPDRGKKKPEPSSLILGTGEKGLDTVLEAGSKTGQGHDDQWLGYMSQIGMPIDTPIAVDVQR